MKVSREWLWRFSAFAAGAIVMGVLFSYLHPHHSIGKQVRLGEGRLTNPLLECEIAQGIIDAPNKRFASELRAEVDRVTATTGVTQAAVFYRDLNNGPAFGVNADAAFIPASLLKVPVLMSFYKHAEKNPGILSKQITYPGPIDLGMEQTILPEEELVPGSTHTVEDLLTRMITYSDNQALILLWNQLSLDEFRMLYDRLGVKADVLTDPTLSLSVQEYSTFFRILFNASYLSQESSEEVLELLTKSTFDKGLRAGVPQEVVVAHKFGERKLDGGEQQIHDCGIVYYPRRPYLLCIMTRGSDTETLEHAIAEISRFMYEEIDTYRLEVGI